MRKSAWGLAFLFLFGTTTVFSQSAVISFSPPSFSFNAVQSGSLPLSQTLQISNSGSGTLGWQISSNVDWLSATPASGSAPGNITVSIIRTNLPPNTYSGKLTILGNATNSPQEVPVSYTVTAPITATISFSPPSFSFNAVQDGSLPVSQTLQINNSGTGTLSWSINSNVNWLSAGLASGTAPGNITVSITRTNLPPGTYPGKLTILGNATNSPREVPVSYTVSPAQTAIISLFPDSFNFIAQEGGSPPPVQTLQIRNVGTGSMTWAFDAGLPSWLSVSPPGPASAPMDVQLTALPVNLIPGTYSYTLKVFSNEATNSPDSVRVNFTIAPTLTAIISLTPDDTINFSASQGGDPSAPQTLLIRNTGTGDMTWVFDEGIPSWLSVIPPGPEFAPRDVQLTAVPGNLPPGLYSHTLQVFSNQATNSPQAVVVNFEVSSPPVPVLQVSDDILTFEAMEGQADPPAQLLTIFNGGGGDLNWELTSDQSWLFPANASGTNTGNVNVSVSIANLAAGPHTGHLTVTASGATGSPRSVTVNLNISPVLTPASLQVSQSSLDFDAQRNQSLPPQFIDISNGGQLPLNWTATVLNGAAWLSINPPSGTDDGTITVSVTTDLSPLTYVDTIKIEAPGAVNAPRFIPVRLNVTTAAGDEPGNRPRSFALFQNYPNPFNPTTKIDFALPRSGHTTLEIFNVVGQRIRVLLDGEMSAGPHSIVWDGRETSGQTVGSGIYFYRLKSLNFSDIKRMVFLK